MWRSNDRVKRTMAQSLIGFTYFQRNRVHETPYLHSNDSSFFPILIKSVFVFPPLRLPARKLQFNSYFSICIQVNYWLPNGNCLSNVSCEPTKIINLIWHAKRQKAHFRLLFGESIVLRLLNNINRSSNNSTFQWKWLEFFSDLEKKKRKTLETWCDLWTSKQTTFCGWFLLSLFFQISTCAPSLNSPYEWVCTLWKDN